MASRERERSGYAPSVRPRSARQDGQRRYTPGYLADLSDTRTLYVDDRARSTRRQTLLRPSRGRRLRLINVTAHQTSPDNLHFCEVYFGTGANIATSPEKAVGFVRVSNQGEGGTRTWGRGAGPAGEKNEPLSVRWTKTLTTAHKFIIEYTEER